MLVERMLVQEFPGLNFGLSGPGLMVPEFPEVYCKFFEEVRRSRNGRGESGPGEVRGSQGGAQGKSVR